MYCIRNTLNHSDYEFLDGVSAQGTRVVFKSMNPALNAAQTKSVIAFSLEICITLVWMYDGQANATLKRFITCVAVVLNAQASCLQEMLSFWHGSHLLDSEAIELLHPFVVFMVMHNVFSSEHVLDCL